MRIGSFLPVQNNLSSSKKSLEKVLEKLSSGKRINSGADDPAGLALANSLKSSAKGLEVANRNISSAQGALRTASGAVGQSIEQLQSLREVAVQAANGTLNSSDRANLQNQFQQGLQNLDDISSNTSFNGQNLVDGSFSTSVQTGAEAGQTTNVSVGDVSSSALGVATQSVSTQEGAQDAIAAIDSALERAVSEQATIGATENALEYRENANAIAQENLEAARSQAEDTDFAEATSELSRQQFIQQAQVAVLQAQLKQQAAVSNQFFGPNAKK